MTNNTLSFLSGGGEMGARMRAHDWSTSPLGPPESWPQSLRSAVSICLNSPVLGTILWGPKMIMIYNDAYIPSMADRHPGALGMPVSKVWGDTWDAIAEPFRHAMATGEGFAQNEVELPMIRNGQPQVTYWNITASPIRGEDGNVVGLLNQGFEITTQISAERERAAAEEELKKLNRQLAEKVNIRTEERNLMWDTAPDLMLIIDFNGVVQRVNPAFTRLLGYSQGHLLGHHVNEFVASEDHIDTINAYTLAARGEQPKVINQVRHADGSRRWVSWFAAPSGNLIYATGRDITLVKKREAELEKAQAQLRQAQKMEAVGQLTGGLAHDFNNLLTAISASLELIRLRISQNRAQETEKYLDAAKGATTRAASLTHRLLAFSRRQTLAPQPVDANQLIEGMLELIRRTVGPEVDVACSSERDPWTALVDPSQLENSLLNLCINARDAMPNGGQIHITVTNHLVDTHAALEQGLPAGEYLRMSVSDTGTGMSPDVVARAFDPFFTTKPMGMGTGLGLSMIYGFAKQSGGQVRIVSTLGEGTEVSLYLPRHQGSASRQDQSPAGLTLPGAGTNETVLIVDDEPSIRMLITDALQDLDYQTIEASTGKAGLQVLRSGAHIDLLVTDVGLPGGMNGRQLADAARATRPDLPVLFITGYAEQALFTNSADDPGMALLTKPFTVADLASRIRMLLRV